GRGLSRRTITSREDRRRPPRPRAGRVPGGDVMFTGGAEASGSITNAQTLPSGALGLTISASSPLVDALRVGASASVSGRCLPVVDRATVSGGSFRVELVEETQRLTVPRWFAGSDVNLEQDMRAGGAFGGHFV